MVSLFSRLTSFPESNKINKVTSVVASNICWKATFNVDFVNEIVDFQKVPEEVSYHYLIGRLTLTLLRWCSLIHQRNMLKCLHIS